MYKSYKKISVKKFFKFPFTSIILIILGLTLVFLVKNIDKMQDLRSKANEGFVLKTQTVVYNLSDLLNQPGSNIKINSNKNTNWLGSGGAKTSYLGLRFNGPALGSDIKVVEAKLVVTASQSDTKKLFLNIFAEDEVNPVSYDINQPSSFPSQRKLTKNYDLFYNSRLSLEKDKNYSLRATKAVQEIVTGGKVNRGWINLVIKGFSNKTEDYAHIYNQLNSGKEPKLIVTYQYIPSVKVFPIQLNNSNKEAKVFVKLSSKPDTTQSVKLTLHKVYDAENDDEGQLFINGNGPIRLFKGKTGPDSATVDIEFLTSKDWWKEGDNELLFKHLYTNGYDVGGATAMAVYSAPSTPTPISTPRPTLRPTSFPTPISTPIPTAVPTPSPISPQSVVAFPGAQGFGAATIGGRGGRVIHVTNLNDSGAGSLREALSASGARIVVFDLSGTITLNNDIYINNPYITIAGQTASGDGITIRNGGIYIRTHDVIVRSLRIRVGAGTSGAGNERHAIIILGNESRSTPSAYNIIIDHCSLSWATDENLDFYGGVQNVTVQWSIISEALMHSIHPKGDHSMGTLFNEYTNDISLHHNLFAHNYYRNPLVQGLSSAEIVNNVVYNWGWEGTYFCNSSIGGPLFANVIGNKYVAGADSHNRGIMIWNDVAPGTKVYVQGNEGPDREDASKGNEWDAVTERSTIARSSSLATKSSGVTIQNVRLAYQDVLSKAGAIAPKRDSYDSRIVSDVTNKTGKVIDNPNQVGGWPSFSSSSSPQDTDRDGIPDNWEISHSLNPNDISDGSKISPSGYTWIEEYINSLI